VSVVQERTKKKKRGLRRGDASKEGHAQKIKRGEEERPGSPGAGGKSSSTASRKLRIRKEDKKRSYKHLRTVQDQREERTPSPTENEKLSPGKGKKPP